MSAGKGCRIVVRGAGDVATGVILRLTRCGYRVIALEIPAPTAIRRTVAFSEAVYEGSAVVEGVQALRADSAADALRILEAGKVPVLVDPDCALLGALEPEALVDAIIAKRNTGTRVGMAPVLIALGPGFTAPGVVDAVIETNRGHRLGRVILRGGAEPNTGTPGLIAGKSAERVVKSRSAGRTEALAAIGDMVREGDPLLGMRDPRSGSLDILRAPIAGLLRGLIRPGLDLPAGFKVADVDPREDPSACTTVSDKALAVAGGVLEALLARGLNP